MAYLYRTLCWRLGPEQSEVSMPVRISMAGSASRVCAGGGDEQASVLAEPAGRQRLRLPRGFLSGSYSLYAEQYRIFSGPHRRKAYPGYGYSAQPYSGYAYPAAYPGYGYPAAYPYYPYYAYYGYPYWGWPWLGWGWGWGGWRWGWGRGCGWARSRTGRRLGARRVRACRASMAADLGEAGFTVAGRWRPSLASDERRRTAT